MTMGKRLQVMEEIKRQNAAYLEAWKHGKQVAGKVQVPLQKGC